MAVPAGFHNVTFIFRAAGATRDATFQIGMEETGSPLDPESVAERCFDAFTFSGAPGDPAIFSDQWTFKGTSDSYQSESEGVLIYQHLEDVVGEVASKPVPVNGALLVKKNTGLGGRRNRGRLFCPPISMDEGTVDVIGNIAPVTLAIIANYWTVFFDQLALIDLGPVLFHSETPFTPTTITGFSLQSQLATQRRRMRR